MRRRVDVEPVWEWLGLVNGFDVLLLITGAGVVFLADGLLGGDE